MADSSLQSTETTPLYLCRDGFRPAAAHLAAAPATRVRAPFGHEAWLVTDPEHTRLRRMLTAAFTVSRIPDAPRSARRGGVPRQRPGVRPEPTDRRGVWRR